MSPSAVKSPISGSLNTALVDDLDQDQAITIYREQLNTDIARYFAGVPRISRYLCRDSGYRFYVPSEVAGDGDFYASLARTDHYYYESRWEHGLCRDLIGAQDKVVEVGCGVGDFLHTIKHRPGSTIGIELNREAAASGRQNGLDIRCQNVGAFAEENRDTDLVCLFHVLEHISDVSGVLGSFIRMIRPGGLLVFSVPNCDAIFFDEKFQLPAGKSQHAMWKLGLAMNAPPHHMGQWTCGAIEALSRYFPLRLRSLRREPVADFRKQLIVELVEARWRARIGGLMGRLARRRYKRLLKEEGAVAGDSLLAVFEVASESSARTGSPRQLKA